MGTAADGTICVRPGCLRPQFIPAIGRANGREVRIVSGNKVVPATRPVPPTGRFFPPVDVVDIMWERIDAFLIPRSSPRGHRLVAVAR